jgi:hypothetical protein
MKKAIIYIPNKNPMQSGLAKNDKWILEFKTKDPTKNPLMGWESSFFLSFFEKIGKITGNYC